MSASIRRAWSVPALVLMAIGSVAQAQRPERQHEIVVPGLGVKLRDHWKLLFHDACRYAVPVTWTAAPDQAEAADADGSRVSVSTIRSTNWELYKSRLKGALGASSRVRNDSAGRLWLELRGSAHVESYVAVFDGTEICGAMIGVSQAQSDYEDVLEAIADSVGPVGAWRHP